MRARSLVLFAALVALTVVVRGQQPAPAPTGGAVVRDELAAR